MNKIKSWGKLIRVKHYIKNILIIFPMFFSKKIIINNIIIIFGGILIFSGISSIVYILNDISDIEKDKLHYLKCKRPLPAGDISKKEAKLGCIIIGLLVCVLIYIFRISFIGLFIILSYLIINVFYSQYAKNIPVIDVLILALGYILRIYLGAELINVSVSNWLYLVVLFGALFMGFGKRRGEIQYNSGKETRKVMQYYNNDFLDKTMYMSLAITVVFYALWCTSDEISANYPSMIWTTVIVYVICMKYTLTLEQGNDGDPVPLILGDKLLLSLLLIYGIILITIMYF